MAQPAGDGGTRLELAQKATVNGLTQLSDTDVVGLWTFPSGSDVYWQQLPLAPLGPERDIMKTRIEQLIPSGGTPLYAATREAVDAIRDGAGDDTINAVVVMTDGKNEYPDDNDLDGLVRQLSDQSFENGVRVFTIAYGARCRLRVRSASVRGVARCGLRRDGSADDQRRIHQRAVELLMARHHFGTRLAVGFCHPWALLLSAFGGGLAWAVGTPLLLSVGAAGIMLVTAAAVGALGDRAVDGPGQLRQGTRQQKLVILLDGHVRSLRALHGRAQAGAVRAQAEAALAAADAARPSVLQVAAALDEIDEAIASARQVSGQGAQAAEAIKKTVGRMKARRSALFERLTAAVDEVATVYAGLLELSATAHTMGVTLDDSEVSAVNDSVTLLQMTFAELEADAAALPTEGFV